MAAVQQELDIGLDIGFEGGKGLAKVPDVGRTGDWMQSWTGKRVYPADPQPQDIDILDIIYALSNLSRYNGHCRFYSVMEHSLLISYLVKPENAKAGFAHDFTEAYLSDICRPVKRILGKKNDWFKIDQGLWEKAIAPKFGLPTEMPKEVIEFDTAICIAEKRVLHPRSDPWYLPFEEPKVKIRCLSPGQAFVAGMKRYCELWGENFEELSNRALFLLAQDAEIFNNHQTE